MTDDALHRIYNQYSARQRGQFHNTFAPSTGELIYRSKSQVSDISESIIQKVNCSDGEDRVFLSSLHDVDQEEDKFKDLFVDLSDFSYLDNSQNKNDETGLYSPAVFEPFINTSRSLLSNAKHHVSRVFGYQYIDSPSVKTPQSKCSATTPESPYSTESCKSNTSSVKVFSRSRLLTKICRTPDTQDESLADSDEIRRFVRESINFNSEYFFQMNKIPQISAPSTHWESEASQCLRCSSIAHQVSFDHQDMDITCTINDKVTLSSGLELEDIPDVGECDCFTCSRQPPVFKRKSVKSIPLVKPSDNMNNIDYQSDNLFANHQSNYSEFYIFVKNYVQGAYWKSLRIMRVLSVAIWMVIAALKSAINLIINVLMDSSTIC